MVPLTAVLTAVIKRSNHGPTYRCTNSCVLRGQTMVPLTAVLTAVIKRSNHGPTYSCTDSCYSLMLRLPELDLA